MPAAYSGEEFVIGFNAEFLRDGVDSIVGDDVRVKLINPPAILEDAAGDFTYLIMPIRLAGLIVRGSRFATSAATSASSSGSSRGSCS